MEFEFLKMIGRVPGGYVENGVPFDMSSMGGAKILPHCGETNSSYCFEMFAAGSLYSL